MSAQRSPREVAREVLAVEAAAVAAVIDQLDERFDEAITLLLGCDGRVICTGMGKSGLVMQKVAATLTSTGTPAQFLHPAEAVHGDLGVITPADRVLAASASGTTQELLRLTAYLERLGVPMIAITGAPDSPLAQHARVHLPAVIDQEACPLGLAPTASTAATMALGDALAMALLEARGFTREDFARLHPGGALGYKLLRVDQLMHTDEALPTTSPNASVAAVAAAISACGFGVAAVIDAGGRLLGCVTDGDLRRLMIGESSLAAQTAAGFMTTSPQTVERSESAQGAMRLLEEHRITALFVCDDAGRLEGLLHLHDLLPLR